MNDPQNQNPADNGVGSTGGSATSAEAKLWQAMQMKADLFDYLCWLEVVTPPDELHGTDFLCMASDGTTCWAKTYAEAVRMAMEHDKEIFDATQSVALPNGRDEPRAGSAATPKQ